MGSNYSPRKVFEGLQFQAEIVQILFWTKIGARVLHHSPRNISVVMIGLVSSSGFSESFHKYLNNVRWANKTDRVRPLGLSIDQHRPLLCNFQCKLRNGNTESEVKSVENLLSLISSLEWVISNFHFCPPISYFRDSSQTMPQTEFMQQYLSDKSDTEDANSWFQNYQNSHGWVLLRISWKLFKEKYI